MSHNVNVFANTERHKRSSNFSSKEVQFLIQLVDKKKEIVESKKTDRITCEEKAKAWTEIEEEFNEVFNDYRSQKVLKTKYDNLKKNVKKNLPINVSNTSILKIMQLNGEMMVNEVQSDFEYTDEETESGQNYSVFNVDTKPITLHNDGMNSEIDNNNVGNAEEGEQLTFETLLYDETQPFANLTNTTKSQTTNQTTEKRKPPLDIWDEVAYTKIKKLNLEISILNEEWMLQKTKLDLELEHTKTENKLKEDT